MAALGKCHTLMVYKTDKLMNETLVQHLDVFITQTFCLYSRLFSKDSERSGEKKKNCHAGEI